MKNRIKSRTVKSKKHDRSTNLINLDKIIEVTLSSGIIVCAEALLIDTSYYGLIEWYPELKDGIFVSKTDLEMNKKYHEYNINRYEKIWCQRKNFIFEQDLDKILPPHVFCVHLDSQAINDKNCGSELVVMWYGVLDVTKTIQEIVEEKIKDIDWNKLAEDWNY